MTDNKKNIDDLFRKGLSGAEVPPPAHAWENIEKEILFEERKKDKRKIIYLTWWGIAASLLLLVSTVFYFTLNNKTNLVTHNQEQISEENIKPSPTAEDTNLHTNTMPSLQEGRSNLITEISSNNISVKTDLPKKDKASDHKKTSASDNINQYKSSYPALSNNTVISKQEASPAKRDATSADPLNPTNQELVDNNYVTSTTKDGINADEPKSAQSTDDQKTTASDTHVKPAVNSDDFLNPIDQNSNGPDFVASTIKDSITADESKLAQSTSDQKAADSLALSTVSLMDTNAVNSQEETRIALHKHFKDSIENLKPSQWFIGGMYLPSHSYETYASAVSANTFQNAYIHNASSKYSYSPGILIGYEVNKKWQVQTGLLYSSIKEEATLTVTDTASSSGAVVITGTKFSSKQSLNFDMKYTYEYFNIPVIFSYKTERNKLSYMVSSGLSANIYYRHGIVAKPRDNNGEEGVASTDPSAFEKVNYSSILSAGLGYRLLNYMNITVEPVFRYSLTSITKNSGAKGEPYSIGIATGLQYHF